MLQAANLPIETGVAGHAPAAGKRQGVTTDRSIWHSEGRREWNLQCACHLRPPSFKSRLGICALMAVLNSEYPSTLFESQEDMIRRVRERVVANLANPEVHCAVMCCASNSTLIISHFAAFC